AEKIYFAGLPLAVGQVDRVEPLLRTLGPDGRSMKLAEALRTLIAAVKSQPPAGVTYDHVSSTLLANSYLAQSQLRLQDALRGARNSVEKSPQFGFGWARVAELEFSFGRIDAAQTALDKALQLSPRNAEALALKGFLLSAENRITQAIAFFDRAIAIDGALGNAWLGRGLCRIRRGDINGGREDLQVAATLEPQGAVLRSYLGKAFSNTSDNARAAKELRLARQLDPKDPTAWLYSGLLNQQENRLNQAVRELQQSQELNENR